MEKIKAMDCQYNLPTKHGETNKGKKTVTNVSVTSFSSILEDCISELKKKGCH